MTAAASTDAAAERELLLTRVLDAPRVLVFKALTEPEHLVRWWGPQGFTLPSCEMDLCPGGAFRFLMRSAEGTEHRLQGIYREVVPPERLVFTWAWVDSECGAGPETLVTLTLEEHGAGTLLTLHQAVFESVTARDAHAEGWTECLERLAAYLAATSSEGA